MTPLSLRLQSTLMGKTLTLTFSSPPSPPPMAVLVTAFRGRPRLSTAGPVRASRHPLSEDLDTLTEEVPTQNEPQATKNPLALSQIPSAETMESPKMASLRPSKTMQEIQNMLRLHQTDTIREPCWIGEGGGNNGGSSVSGELTATVSGNVKQRGERIWENVVRKGDVVVDATCGNGHDTFALLKMVADESVRGCVYGLDIQNSAVEYTSSLLDASLEPKRSHR
ncbi:hypothetical protein QJS10_CPA09g00719 [Acorus calamus]|uniref:S-adenosyl-L-methionine-dependent methyltransferase superfamily protein n=1 Tax=Acorus calamus TaxID=4465 RepID=A0AAV9E8I5_ACOCL|nr:hypothetical protein QJS10_CPA09g00719 [Acorus calamus]